MSVVIKLCKKYADNDSLAIIIENEKQIPPGIFSDDEKKYLEKELKADKKTIIINQYKRLVAVHLVDKKKERNAMLEACRKSGDSFQSAANKAKLEQVVIVDKGRQGAPALAFAEGMALGNYQFLKFRKEKAKEANSLKNILIQSSSISDREIKNLQVIIEATHHARNLVNEPQSSQSATQLAGEFVKLSAEAGFKAEVFDKSKIEELKMGGVLAVNLGSIEPPTFTVMEWKPRGAKNKKPYVLVGKGVVYDTGGLSLKTTLNSMDYMKSDMAGSAAVACTMYAIAKAKLPLYVVALVPATDNRPSENAYAPGDVITMMSGQTVEVLNTDAEGRLILADALHYAKQFNPELVMDFATLTGAAAIAIGSYGIVCMGTANENTKNKLKKSADAVYERLAEFPIWDEYDDLLKSDIADMKNIGGPIAGAITAGKFLQRYIDYPWMHFDIAGPSFLHSSQSYRGKNASGVGVRFLFDFFSKL